MFLNLLFLFDINGDHPNDPSVNMEDIAFVVWSGKECIPTRVRALAQAYFNCIPEVHVYTDYISDEDANTITNENPNLNITFYCTQMRGDYLIGSAYENPYNHAQMRHLLSMYDIYPRLPNKKWFYFVDDDCYVIPSKLLQFARENGGYIHGMSYYFIPETYYFFNSTDPTRTFYHGGPGVLMRNSFLKDIVSNLKSCDSIYQVTNMGSDIRFSACMAKKFGAREWNVQRRFYGSYNAFDVFSSNTPDIMISRDEVVKQTHLSFHLIHPEDTQKIWKSHISKWRNGKNKTIYVDWGDYCITETKLDIGGQGNTMKFNIMYAMRSNNLKLYSDTQPTPVFKKGDKERVKPTKYVQTYANNSVKIEYICNNKLEKGDMVIDSFLAPPEYGTRVLIKCPESKDFYVYHDEKIKPKIVNIIPDHK